MDFQQGLITTIHDFGIPKDSSEALRIGLNKHPTAILIPCLYEEFSRPALKLIRRVLETLDGLQLLVIALSASSADEVLEAKAFFANMPFEVHIQWTNSPSVLELLKGKDNSSFNLSGKPGKGWAVWQGIGLATSKAEVVALFDADIRTFSLSYPARMLQPLLDPSFDISYVKAFYSRLSIENNALHGRATRLFVGPLLTSLEQLLGNGPFLNYLNAFRYPLAGEFAFRKELAINLRIPCDWGLEVGLLSEVYKNISVNHIAQVDLGVFDHKHKIIGSSPNEGLQKMCQEVLASILRGLMENQAETLNEEKLSSLEVHYRRIGEDRVKQFELDSLVNQIPYNRREEELGVETFSKLIKPAIRRFMESPTTELMPCWSTVDSCNKRLRGDLAIAGTVQI